MREPGDALALDAPMSWPLLMRLESAGLLQRNRLPEDQRTLAVSSTQAGRALRTQAEQAPGQVVERSGVAVSQLAALRDGLTKIIGAASATSGGADRQQ